MKNFSPRRVTAEVCQPQAATDRRKSQACGELWSASLSSFIFFQYFRHFACVSSAIVIFTLHSKFENNRCIAFLTCLYGSAVKNTHLLTSPYDRSQDRHLTWPHTSDKIFQMSCDVARVFLLPWSQETLVMKPGVVPCRSI